MFQADKKPILFNKELSGGVVTFNSRLKNMPLSKCKITIPISQQGSGTPSPDNIREFNTFSSVDFTSNGNTYIISFGQSIYSCVVDVKTGILTITHGVFDLGNLAYQYRDTYELFYSSVNTSVKLATPNCACSGYLFNPDAIGTSISSISRKINDKEITTFENENNQGRFVIKDTNYTDVASLKEAIAGIKLVYELAEPIEVILEGHTIEAIKGVNNIFANIGTTTVGYVEVK